MAPRSRSRARKSDVISVKDNNLVGEDNDCHICFKLKVIFASLLAPLPLIYLNLRCQKNFCILYQAPLTLPTNTSAYFSYTAFALLLGFFAFQDVWSTALHYLFPANSDKLHKDGQPEASTKIHQGFLSLMFFVSLLIGLFVFWPEAIIALHKEHLRFLTAAWVICFGLSFLQMVLVFVLKIIPDQEQTEQTCLGIFYKGTDVMNTVVNFDLKHFTYVNIGLVGWAILDLLMLLNSIHEGKIYNPAVFLAVSQIMYIAATVYAESILLEKPYMDMEKFGYNWLQKVVIFLPFLSSLVTYSAVVNEFDISPAVLLCNTVFFLFGFVVHTSSLQQMQRFLKDPKKATEMDALPGKVAGIPNKKFLVSGYWSFVHRPDLLGLLIMWTSWAIAGGLNALSLIVFGCWLFKLMSWAKLSDEYNRVRFPKGWEDYVDAVPHMLLPYLY